MNAGYLEEAKAWREWLSRAAAGTPNQLQIMYGIAGERRLTEWEIPWLPGYRNSSPVRVGNAAHTQLQLDVYGELMDALHHARQGGLASSESDWKLQRAVLEHLEEVWPKMDEGIWEVRSEARHFTHSKVMAWVAFDRAIKSAEAFNLEGPLDRWRQLCREIHDEVCRRGLIRNWAALCVLTGRRISTPACCFCQWLASCRRKTRACGARSMRSSANFSWMGWSCATTRQNPKTACRPTKVYFSPARGSVAGTSRRATPIRSSAMP